MKIINPLYFRSIAAKWLTWTFMMTLWHVGVCFFSNGLIAQTSVIEETNASEKDKDKVKKGGESGWLPPQQKTFSKGDRKAECRKYEGKLISYYGRVFKVKSCKRREIVGPQGVSELTRKGQKITPVGNDTIIMLEEGQEWAGSVANAKRSCRVLERQYVITGSSEIYFVENCKRRPFPDWETYRDHRAKKSKQKSTAVLDLTQDEFDSLKEGEPFVSVLDEAYRKLLNQDEEVDIIPLKEACRGLNGRFVTYYSRVYKIEACKKREVRSEGSLQKRIGQLKNLKELSSSQWISLPNGKALTLK